ncbi:MAG: hypothetical protein QOE58_109 [Actinomycetota bacterium]|nr:hypothetical protein [Actinomycetota bacterium]
MLSRALTVTLRPGRLQEVSQPEVSQPQVSGQEESG